MVGDHHAGGSPARSVESWYRRGLALRRDGFDEEALDMYREALLIDSTHRESLIALGSVLGKLGRWSDARRVYEQARGVFPDDEELRELLVRATSRSSELSHEASPRQSPVLLIGPTGRTPYVGKPAHLVKPGRSRRIDERILRKRAGLGGFLAFAVVAYTYITVGLMTHYTVGLAAAGGVALMLAAAGTLFFPRHRRLAFRMILIGMLVGLAAALLVALGSLAIALFTAAGRVP